MDYDEPHSSIQMNSVKSGSRVECDKSEIDAAEAILKSYLSICHLKICLP